MTDHDPTADPSQPPQSESLQFPSPEARAKSDRIAREMRLGLGLIGALFAVLAAVAFYRVRHDAQTAARLTGEHQPTAAPSSARTEPAASPPEKEIAGESALPFSGEVAAEAKLAQYESDDSPSRATAIPSRAAAPESISELPEEGGALVPPPETGREISSAEAPAAQRQGAAPAPRLAHETVPAQKAPLMLSSPEDRGTSPIGAPADLPAEPPGVVGQEPPTQHVPLETPTDLNPSSEPAIAGPGLAPAAQRPLAPPPKDQSPDVAPREPAGEEPSAVPEPLKWRGDGRRARVGSLTGLDGQSASETPQDMQPPRPADRPAEPSGAGLQAAGQGMQSGYYDRQSQTYTVGPNENYWLISKRLYGSTGYFKALFEHNRHKHPSATQLRAGDVLSAPPVSRLEQLYPQLCPRRLSG